jgi:hypothetical protein
MGSCSADGDLVAMDTARAMLRLNGELLVTVPCGEVDYVVWNAQRIYGPVRLPLLLSGWEVLVAQQTPFPATSPRYITAAPDAQCCAMWRHYAARVSWLQQHLWILPRSCRYDGDGASP